LSKGLGDCLAAAATSRRAAHEKYFNNLATSKQSPAELGDYFMSVLRVAPVQHRGNPPLAVQSHFDLRIVDWFQPSELPTPPDAIQFGDATNPVPLSYMDWKDMDFGSSSCLVLPEISGRHFVLVSTKAFIFLLDGDSLGNAKMPLQALHYFQGKDALDDTAESHSAMTYLFAKGEHLIYASGGGNPGLVCFQLVFDGHTARLSPKWQADISLTNACASPTVGFSNIGVLGQPEFNALVGIADIAENKKTGAEAFIKAYNALSGHPVFDSRQTTDQIENLPHFAPITCAGNSVYLGTQAGFVQFHATNPSFVDSIFGTDARMARDG
jgi:hypothetical protein